MAGVKRTPQDSRPISPAEAVAPRDGALPAYVANGLVGLRIRGMALAPGICLLNGGVARIWNAGSRRPRQSPIRWRPT